MSPVRDGNGVQRDRVEKQMQREWSWKTGETDKEEEKEVADLRTTKEEACEVSLFLSRIPLFCKN